MRVLLILSTILSLLTQQIYAATCASGTLYYRPYTTDTLLVDNCSNYNGVSNGTLLYNGSGCGSQSSAIGPFTDSDYVTEGAGFLTAFSGLTSYTIEFDVYGIDQFTNSPVLFSWNGGFIQITYQQVNFNSNSNQLVGANAFSAATCYHIACVTDGSTKNIYVNNVLKGTNSSGGSSGTATYAYTGRYSGATGFALNGYISNLRISNVARSSFPTTDPVGTATNTPTPTISPTHTMTPTYTFTPTQTVTLQASDFASGPIGLGAMSGLEHLPKQKFWTQAKGLSSFDREGANADSNKWLYTYTSGSDALGVIADIAGPGCLYRWWMTGANPVDYFDYTLIVDGAATTITGTTPETLFSGTFSPFDAPLAASYTTSCGGNTSYLPIPFQSSLKIIDNQHQSSSYDFYNIGLHVYGAGTYVTPWAGTEDSASVIAMLNSIPNDPKNSAGALTVTGGVSLAAGGSQTIFNSSGPRQIVSIKLDVPSHTAAIRNALTIQIYWDGETTPSVDAPLAYFFNAGGMYEIATTPQQLMVGVDNDDYLYNYFPMPYARRAVITLTNTGVSDVNGMTYWVNYLPYTGSFAGVGYFKSQFKTTTFTDSSVPVVNLLTADGHGSYLGSVISLSGTGGTYLQEGDEAVYVDGCKTPIMHGTGMEDYGNAAWGFIGLAFSQPMYGASFVAGSGAVQFANFTRLLLQDQIPYLSNIQVNLQHGRLCDNGEAAVYKSLVWYYNQPAQLLNRADVLYLSSTASVAAHGYVTTGDPVSLSGYYLQDVSMTCTDYMSNTGYAYAFGGTSSFNATIPHNNKGLVLRGTFDKDSKPKRVARVKVNGLVVGDWSQPEYDRNSGVPWEDHDFMIPPYFTANNTNAYIQLENISSTAWNEYKYEVFAVSNPSDITTGLDWRTGRKMKLDLRPNIK